MILFFDTEVNSKQKRISDMGCVTDKGEQLHSSNVSDFSVFFRKADFYIGHNVINHDFLYLKKSELGKFVSRSNCIDTLFLSTLLFPQKPYHKLVKDDKLETQTINNPLNDAKNAQRLFYEEVQQFSNLNQNVKEIYYNLLQEIDGFSGFFRYLKYQRRVRNLEDLILRTFDQRICKNINLTDLIRYYPVELSYSLALISTNDVTSLLPSWVLKNFPNIESVMTKVRNTPCAPGCSYCHTHLDPVVSLKKYFNYDKFREFDGVPLQRQAVDSAIKNESLIVVFPTGGGKSLTFQLPALMTRENTRSLTVVISPLQSLMKDQVDSLESKSITSAVTINGLLNPLERKEAVERVADGSASLLYISPESLRSKTIENLLIGRNIARFVIDEAHCFSTWGHDFRVDYLYIGKFIKRIQEKKNMNVQIPVSCFTATAKKDVIHDISAYFKKILNLELKLFTTDSKRRNLKYKVYEVKDLEQKYQLLRSLIEQENCPTIVYSARQKTVEDLRIRLVNDGFQASAFHGGMEKDQKIKEQNQFMTGYTQIMVATSAFGMGVDKKDVGCVIHYEISDSLENYMQESGRAGRDENIEANCYILYFEDDLNKHFDLLSRSKLNIKEIQQIWKTIKEATKLKDSISKSALEIARQAGWDDSLHDLQTRITTAVSVLEECGLIQRGQNTPSVYANSILSKSVMDAHAKIDRSDLFDDEEKKQSKRIISKLIAAKYKSWATEDPESRVDYISDELGISKEDVIRAVNLMKAVGILADDKDLGAYIKSSSRNTSHKLLTNYLKLIRFIFSKWDEDSISVNLKVLNEEAIQLQLEASIKSLQATINYLDIAKYLEMKKMTHDLIRISFLRSKQEAESKIDKLASIAESALDLLYDRANGLPKEQQNDMVLFSVVELKNNYMQKQQITGGECTLKEVEDSLVFLNRIGALQIEGGFMVIYSPLNIERLNKESQRIFTKKDYSNLEQFYTVKMEQIHIVGEYAKKMIENYQSALTFADDYFTYEYNDFLEKYFFGKRRKEIERNMTPSRFQELFGSLTEEQLAVIIDKNNKRIAVAAGPGSGKTKLLVHKLASILQTEDIRTEHLLMLTFSRAASTEFKSRLFDLIGPPAAYVEIKTFHSFCFDILGRVGAIEHADSVVSEATSLIKNNEADPFRITKMVLVIDEAQDMNEQEFQLIEALIEYNDNLRVIAVGDDDQNIFEFRGSSSEYFRQLSKEEAFYELSINFRSKHNIVEFANRFVEKLTQRLKKKPILAKSKENGTLRVTHYESSNLIIPLVEDIIDSDFPGETAVITRTNEEASLIAGLLNYRGYQARLIQSNDDFNLADLKELRSFVELLKKKNRVPLNREDWNECVNALTVQYENSNILDLISFILERFVHANRTHIYLSDFIDYINESSLSDFTPKSKVVVSTIHKAKGKEFDNVFLMFTHPYSINDSERRGLYVAITRAKSRLLIHTNHSCFTFQNQNHVEYFENKLPFDCPSRMVYSLTHRDVALGYFMFVQKGISQLVSGTQLEYDQDSHLLYKGNRVLKFSKAFLDIIQLNNDRSFYLTSASCRLLVYWYDSTKEQEVLIMLPEVTFEYQQKSELDDFEEQHIEEEIKNPD